MGSKSDYMPVECLQVPKILFRDSEYRKMSVDAKVLYALLLDRMNMAAFNGWVDDYGTRYVIYPKSEMRKDLNATRYRVDMALGELFQNGKMVVVTHPCPGRPCRIYVRDITGKKDTGAETGKEYSAMKRMATEEEMKRFRVDDPYGDQKDSDITSDLIEWDQDEDDLEIEELLRTERRLGILTAFMEIAEFSAAMIEKYLIDTKPQSGSEELEKENFEELYKRDLINSKGQPNMKIISWRSRMCAMLFARELTAFEDKNEINCSGVMELLDLFYEEDDHESIKDVLFILCSILNLEISEMDDFKWLQGGMIKPYITSFMKTLREELCSRKGEESGEEDEEE